MNIGIAINGEGRGHLSRAVALAEILGLRHDIEFWVPEHFHDELRRRFPRCRVHSITYLKFVQKGFTLSYRQTVIENKQTILGAFRESARISRELKDCGIDALLSDFEPFCSRGAKLAGIPVLQLNHPGVVRKRPALSVPGIISQLVACYMMRGADRTLICSFFDGDIGPIIRRELREKTVTEGNHIVVYQKKQYRDILFPVLSALEEKGFEFKVFPDSGMDYAKELASCRAVVCPAGHQSISEALALGKPAFVIPVKGQFEQELNASMLRKSGFGAYAFEKDVPALLPEFLEGLEDYRNAIHQYRLLTEDEKRRSRWNCCDSTLKAAAMVEQFLSEIPQKPEWKEIPFFDSLRYGLYFAGAPA